MSSPEKHATIWNKLWERIRGSDTVVTKSISIPRERLSGVGEFPPEIVRGEHYFSVVINEMFLAQSRQFLGVYDPLVFAVCEFSHKGQDKTVPFVLSPSLIAKNIQDVPNGVALTDTTVAGPYPYAGGKLALTIILAQVQSSSITHKLLGFAGDLAKAFPGGTMLESQLKMAGTIFDAVETLFGQQGTKALIGHRWEYDPGRMPFLTPGYYALINGEAPAPGRNPFSVVNGGLCEDAAGKCSSYRKSDYVLYSLLAHDRRTDFQELPFYYLFERCLSAAGSPSEESWARAKAGLVTLFQEMIISPDLVWGQAKDLIEEFKRKVTEVQSIAQRLAEDHETFGQTAYRPRQGQKAGLATGDSVRDGRLHELYELLDLKA